MTTPPIAISSIDERLVDLIKMGETRSYAKNEMLITEGEASDALFILVSGRLKVFSQNESGREIVYNIVEPGEILGEMFLDGGRRSASVKATIASQCVVLDELTIQGLIKKNSEFALSLIQVLISRLRNATHTIRDLALSDVFGRTTSLLNTLSIREGRLRVVPSNLTQQEIASRVGATREMINHVISDLTKSGYVSRDERRRLVFAKDLPRTSKTKTR